MQNIFINLSSCWIIAKNILTEIADLALYITINRYFSSYTLIYVNDRTKKQTEEKIDNLDEDYLLEELLNIIELESHKTKVVKIPEDHKKALEISLKEMDNGRTMSHDDVIQDLKNDFTN